MLFRRFRFAENDGKPFCPHCGCVAYYEIRRRKVHSKTVDHCINPLFKCQGCTKQYSLTSGTAFAYRKLSIKTILQILAKFASAYKGRSAVQIRADLRRKVKNYRTIFVWLHKIRCALKRLETSLRLSGEVEIDGKEIGGYIRPANKRQDGGKKNSWKVPYRDGFRKLIVVSARERNGAGRTWVAKQEHHPVKPFLESLEPGTVVFSDAAPGWSEIKDSFDHYTVSHRDNFYTPEACTNFAESGFRILSDMERNYSRMIGNYLDLYAAEMGWRHTHTQTRKSDDDRFASILKAMVTPGRSPMAGYFLPRKRGGQKRACQIVTAEGAEGTWSFPSSDERRRSREAARNSAQAEVTSRVSDARSSRDWNKGFTLIEAEEFFSDPKVVPAGPGVYVLFVKDGSQVLSAAGYAPDPKLATWEERGCLHLYTGESLGMRGRLTQHLLEGIRESDLRKTLLSIFWKGGAPPGGLPDFSDRQAVEDALTEWMRTHVVIGFKTIGYTRTVERLMLERAASPLNIGDRTPSTFSRLLTQLRGMFQDAVVNGWPPPPPKVRKRQRR